MNQQKAQKDPCPLASMLWVNQDQDITQIYLNMKTHASANKHYEFSKWS